MFRASGKHAMDRSKRVFAALTASALLLLVSLTVIGSNDPANLSVAQVGNVILPAAPTNNFDQFVIVLMENHDLSDIYGPAPYMTQLADQYAFSQPPRRPSSRPQTWVRPSSGSRGTTATTGTTPPWRRAIRGCRAGCPGS